jgi:hypothetical protein
LLASLRDSMERLQETTPTPPQSVLEEFNRKFRDEDKSISRPIETNGLHKIKIYREKVDETHHTPRESTRDASEPRPAGGSSRQDTSRVQSEASQSSQRLSGSSNEFERTNPLFISVSEPLQQG